MIIINLSGAAMMIAGLVPAFIVGGVVDEILAAREQRGGGG